MISKVQKFSPSKLAIAKIKTGNNHEFRYSMLELSKASLDQFGKILSTFWILYIKNHQVSNVIYVFFGFFVLTTFFQSPEPNELIKSKIRKRKCGTKYFHLRGRNT